MLKFLAMLPAICFVMSSAAQLNVNLAGSLAYDENINDVWGYTGQDNTEYALVGTQTGFSIVTLASPETPEELFFVEGSNSTWRDVKTWAHHAYVITEAPDGILIVNLESLPDSISWKFDYVKAGPFGDSVVSNHNIFIDEYGIAYLSGGNLNNGGVVLLDVATDPWNPRAIGFANSRYSHDAYARDSLLYSADIYAGELSVQDVSDPKNIQLLGTVKTPSEFTHNVWLSDDNNVVFTTDERSNAFVTAYDVTDFGNMKELDRFRPAATLGQGVIPHNVHVFNDYLIISYYTDGCIIVDASRPDNLIEVGNFDTYFSGSGGFDGVWGAYPFLPSGKILISDRGSGLYVLEPNYVRGGYLEGVVREFQKNTENPLAGVSIEIVAEEITEPVLSKPDGTYKTGKAVPGTFDVKFTKAGYRDTVVPVHFDNGVVVNLDIFLTPLPRFQMTGQIIRSADGAPGSKAKVLLENADFTYETAADSLGNYILEGIYEGSYNVFAGSWGHYLIRELDIQGPVIETLVLEPGYYDDFSFDFGWEVEGSSIAAKWERGIPKSGLLFNFFQCNPQNDVEEDLGQSCFITGNAGGNASQDDVDNGYTLLSSPAMDLTLFSDPVITYRPWICHFGAQTSFTVLASNGQDTVQIDIIRSDDIAGTWQEPSMVRIGEELAITDQMKIHFLASDSSGETNESILKAGVDHFVVTGELSTAVITPRDQASLFNAFPNPFDRSITIRVDPDARSAQASIILYNATGTVLHQITGNAIREDITLSPDIPAGIYFLQYRNADIVQTEKLIKAE